jgi:hypothetical protein
LPRRCFLRSSFQAGVSVTNICDILHDFSLFVES